MFATQYRIARPTDQLAAVIRFYHEVLGLPIIGSFENHDEYAGVMIGMPDAAYHLEFTRHAHGSPCPAPTKDNLLVFYFDDPAGYQQQIERLKSFGHSNVEPENPYWAGKSETFEDPDGWRVVIFNGLFESDNAALGSNKLPL